MRTILFLLRKIMQKSGLENRHGSIRQLTAQKNSVLIFRKIMCWGEKLSLIFSFTWLFIICSVLWNALLCSPLASPCSLALPSFKLNTSFLIFTIWFYLQHLDFVAVTTNYLVTGLQLDRKLPQLKSSLQDNMLLEGSVRHVPSPNLCFYSMEWYLHNIHEPHKTVTQCSFLLKGCLPAQLLLWSVTISIIKFYFVTLKKYGNKRSCQD